MPAINALRNVPRCHVRKRAAPSATSMFLSLNRAVETTGFSYTVLYSAVKSGDLRAVSMSCKSESKRPAIYVDRKSLEEWIAQRRTGNEQAA